MSDETPAHPFQDSKYLNIASANREAVPEDRTRTIFLTGRAPVAIKDSEWPIIASARWHDGGPGLEFQANRRAWIYVRRHEDGRTIVYGGFDSHIEEEQKRAGRYMENHPALMEAVNLGVIIMFVCSEIGRDQLAQSCLNDLPAEVL